MANTVDIDTESLTQPLAYKEWFHRVTNVYVSEKQAHKDYNQYVTQWYSKKNKSINTHSTDVKDMYISFLKDITLNYTTAEEKRFLINIDFDNPRDLDIIIPFFARKIKQITQYHVKKREEVVQSSFRNTMKGSDRGVEMSIKKFILSLLSDESFVSQFNVAKPDIQKISSKMVVETEELFETQPVQYDLDPKNLNKTQGETSVDEKHLHVYEVDENGNGWAKTAYHPEEKDINHKHEVKNWKVIPAQSPCHPNCEDQFGHAGAPPHVHTLMPSEATQLAANIEDIDPLLFLDMTKVVINHLKECDTALATSDCILPLKTKVSQSNSRIGINIDISDWESLPLSSFIGHEKTYDNLVFHQQKNLITKYMGTRFYYLSTGAAASDYTVGILFEPDSPHANILNRHYPGHLTVPVNVEYKTLREMGGFFIPSKMGTLTFASYNPTYKVDVGKLKPNKIYAYPDPNVYGAGVGLTRFDQEFPITHHEHVNWVKHDRSNYIKSGDVVDTEILPKFNAYQSREESTGMQPSGLSKRYDKIDFWRGNFKNIWANDDLYPTKPLHDLPIQDRLGDLLISNEVISEWRTDIYGNEFALYKHTHPTRQTAGQKSGDLIPYGLPDSFTSFASMTSDNWFTMPGGTFVSNNQSLDGHFINTQFNPFIATWPSHTNPAPPIGLGDQYYPVTHRDAPWGVDSEGNITTDHSGTMAGGLWFGKASQNKESVYFLDTVVTSTGGSGVAGIISHFNYIPANTPDSHGVTLSLPRTQFLTFNVSRGDYSSLQWFVAIHNGGLDDTPITGLSGAWSNFVGGGWAGSTVRIRVEKTGDVVSGYVSPWGPNSAKLRDNHELDINSQIKINVKTGTYWNGSSWDGLPGLSAGMFSDHTRYGIAVNSHKATFHDIDIVTLDPKYQTRYTSSTSLTSQLPISERRDTTGTIHMRNIYSTQIEPLSSALSAVFLKYHDDVDVLNEINNNILNFDIIKDILFLETPNYLIIEKYDFDFTTEKFISVLSRKVNLSMHRTTIQNIEPLSYPVSY
jgi:hypothetical protein